MKKNSVLNLKISAKSRLLLVAANRYEIPLRDGTPKNGGTECDNKNTFFIGQENLIEA